MEILLEYSFIIKSSIVMLKLTKLKCQLYNQFLSLIIIICHY